MMEMDGRDSAKCRKYKLKDMIGINRIVNKSKDKITNSVISYIQKGKKREGGEMEMQ